MRWDSNWIWIKNMLMRFQVGFRKLQSIYSTEWILAGRLFQNLRAASAKTQIPLCLISTQLTVQLTPLSFKVCYWKYTFSRTGMSICTILISRRTGTAFLLVCQAKHGVQLKIKGETLDLMWPELAPIGQWNMHFFKSYRAQGRQTKTAYW